MSYAKEFIPEINRTVFFNTKSQHIIKYPKFNYLRYISMNQHTVIVINEQYIYNKIIKKTKLHRLQYITDVKLQELGFNCIDLIIQENINENIAIHKILKNNGICITKKYGIDNMIVIDSHDDWYYYKKADAEINPIELKRILLPDMPQLKYERTEKTVKNTIHWGQRKLLLTEIEFLTKYLAKSQNDIIVVYAGSAPGTHIQYLSELFPEIQFELYDPREFSEKLTSKKINTHVQYFTDETAKKWRSSEHKEDILLISDIRTGEPLTMTPDEVENRVKIDHEWQLNWYNIIKPKYTMFKFRLPWQDGSTMYLDGDIYIQPFPPSTSTETRLIVKENAQMKLYNNRLYENQLFYHNNHTRKQQHINPLMHIETHKKNYLTNDFDSASEIYIIQQYLKLKNITDTNFEHCINMSKEINKISNKRTFRTEHPISEKKIEIIQHLKKDGYIPQNAKPSQSTYNTYVIPQYKKFISLGYI